MGGIEGEKGKGQGEERRGKGRERERKRDREDMRKWQSLNLKTAILKMVKLFLRTRKRRALLQKGEGRQGLLKYAHSFRILGNVHVQINKRLSAS